MASGAPLAIPETAQAHAHAAEALLAEGRTVEAAAAFRRAIGLEPSLTLFDAMVRGVMPGPNYHLHMTWLHRLMRPQRYLEIGVFRGDTLHLAQPPTQVLGVDPEPKLLSDDFAAETRLFTMTSDAFFAADHWGATLGDITLDLSFIDGAHVFEQVLRDFINVERHSTAGSAVVFHDTLPLVAIAAERQVSASFWTGDVWKIIPCLAAFRPDLRIVTIPTRPSGLSVVTGLDPTSRVLETRFDEAVARFIDLPFDWLEPRLPALLAGQRNDLGAAARALGLAG
jgi:hypothetical protein